MIEQSKLLKVTAAIVAISMLFGLLSFWKVRYQFYLWEILFDLKVLTILGLFAYFFRRRDFVFDASQLSFFTFDWKRNVVWFAVPLFIYAAVIGAGLAAGDVKINTMDNAVTLVLATVFDIPAIYVFSATSILIEEIMFRGIIVRSYVQTSGVVRSIIIAGLLWTVYMVSDIAGTEIFDAAESAVLTLFFFAVGLLLAALSMSRGNVWFGYSLRIGLVTLTPIILTSRINESDSFFTTPSLLFFAEGMVVSGIIALIAAIVTFNFRKNSPVSLN
jgi:membrane protease YdiL (CAAX protease family)